MAQKQELVISSANHLLEARTRPDFLKVIGGGGVLVMQAIDEPLTRDQVTPIVLPFIAST